MEIRSLENTSSDELFQAFEQAFADYEIRLNRAQHLAMLKRRGFRPELSFAAFDGDRIVSFTCNGTGDFYGSLTAYDTGTLPHKTVALLSGSGWIGKNNLFITPEYGAAHCLGTVLTDAPLETVVHTPLLPKCGNCSICADVCEKYVLKRKTWHAATPREEIVDVYGCNTCLKCLVHCLHTQLYMKRKIR